MFSSLISAPKIAFFLGLMISVWGLLSYNSISKENAPYIAYGIVNISTAYSGVSAADINDLVTEKIEAKIKNISGLSSYSSVSSNGASNITLRFDPDVDMVKAMSDVRSKVAESASTLPSDLDNDPVITEIDSSLTPFFTIVLSGNYSALQLYDYAKDLEKALESVNSVSKIAILGGAERQIKVSLDRDKMQTFGIGIEEVVTTLKNANKDVPVGDIDIGDKKYIVRFEGKFTSIADIEKVIIKNLQKNTNEPTSFITIKDIATVQEEGKDDPIITRITQKNSQTENAIFISVSRNISGNIFSVDRNTRTAVEEFAKKNFPADLHVSYTNEVLPNIEKSFKEVFTVGYEAIFIVIIIIFLFVGVVEGIISSVIIPITVLLTIGILNLMGSSLNFMTNFSMILALGILVDNAIVIVQGIHKNMQQGMHAATAARNALKEFTAPLISGTLTTLAVFLPLLSLPGILGKYLSFIPITVSIALFSSLLIALFLISSYAANILPITQKWASGYKIGFIEYIRAKINYFIDNVYTDFLNKILVSRILRLSLLLGSFVLLVLSAHLPIASEQFPVGDSDSISVQIEKPVGTLSSSTLTEVMKLETMLLKFPETKHVSTTINHETATVEMELLPKETREKMGMNTSLEIEKKINEFLRTLQNTQSRVSSAQKGPPVEAPVSFRVIVNAADKMEEAKQLTQELTVIMKKIDGTTGVKNNIKEIPGEFRFVINREKALGMGINPDTVAMTIRSVVNGVQATTLARGRKDIDVIVEYETKSLKTLEDIKKITILNANGASVPLSELISQTQSNGVQSIFREDGDTAFTISAFLGTTQSGDDANADNITKAFQQAIASINIPEGIVIKDNGERAVNEDLNTSLMLGGITAILLMYFIVFLQFRSFLQPIIILQTIIFAQMGVNAGLFLFDIPKSLAYTLGLITLFGIIVNHTIILIDQINKNRRAYGDKISYSEVISIVVNGCKSRFHPIVMTGLATIAGLIPLLSVDEFWHGLASTIIFGMITATILVFFVTPATYVQLEKEKFLTFAAVFATSALMALVYVFFI